MMLDKSIGLLLVLGAVFYVLYRVAKYLKENL